MEGESGVVVKASSTCLFILSLPKLFTLSPQLKVGVSQYNKYLFPLVSSMIIIKPFLTHKTENCAEMRLRFRIRCDKVVSGEYCLSILGKEG